MDLTGKPFEASDRKINRKKTLNLAEKKRVERKDFESNNSTFPLQTVQIRPS